jgi:hypothetical protein
MMYLRTKFDAQSSIASLAVAIKSITMENDLRVAMLLACFLQQIIYQNLYILRRYININHLKILN